MTMIKEAIDKVVQHGDLSYDEAYQTMGEIMRGETTPTQNAAFLAALSTKNTWAETIEEISGCACAMREIATPVEHPGVETLEIVGTGGDRSNTFNISTTAALLCAAAGAKVTKHGNRAASSQSGTADCLEALGVNLDQDPGKVRAELDGCGLSFLFAQKYHPAMRYVGPIRRELGFRTVFNILGPLTNPARPRFFLLGVYDGYLCEPLANVLSDLGVRRAFVVYGEDRMDEISISAPTKVCELRDGYYRTITITPEQFGLTRAQKSAVMGGTPAENAQITRDILAGEETGPKRDVAVLNAGAALYLAERASTIADGIALAQAQIDSGEATRTLGAFVRESNA